jgi:hypothetical protein
MAMGKMTMMVGAAVLAGALGANAAPQDDTTYVTFHRTVQIPGATLTPGTYIFEEVETGRNDDVVRVLSRDRRRVFLTQFATAIERPEGPAAQRDVVLSESKPGEAPRVISWFHPGSPTGHDFVYGDLQE